MKSPIEDLVKVLKEDADYKESWIANIAMAIYDAALNYKDPPYTLEDLRECATA